MDDDGKLKNESDDTFQFWADTRSALLTELEEFMPEEEITVSAEQETSDADGKNAGEAQAGTETQAVNKAEAEPEEKKFSQADVNRMFQQRLQKEVRKELQKELKKLTGEQDGQPTVEELKGRAETAENELRRYQARDQVEAYIADKRNNVTVRNVRGLMRQIEHDFEYDDQGKVTNVKELIGQAKADVPELFGTVAGSADAGAGARSNGAADMNTLIRQRAGYG